MSRLITAAERITKARELIQKARNLKRSDESEWPDFSYAADVKDLLRQARDLLKFISYTVGIPAETKAETKKVQEEIDSAEKELLHK